MTINVANEEHLAEISSQATLMTTLDMKSDFLSPEIRQAYLELSIAALKIKCLFSQTMLDSVKKGR